MCSQLILSFKLFDSFFLVDPFFPKPFSFYHVFFTPDHTSTILISSHCAVVIWKLRVMQYVPGSALPDYFIRNYSYDSSAYSNKKYPSVISFEKCAFLTLGTSYSFYFVGNRFECSV